MYTVNTYNLTEEDFEKCYLSTVTPVNYDCPKCGARVDKWCDGIQLHLHTERIQALYDKCKDILEKLTSTKREDHWLNLG